MSVSKRIPLIVLMCGLCISAALPMQAMNVDKPEQRGPVGSPVININITSESGDQAHLKYIPRTFRGFIAKSCSNFFSRPIPLATKIVGGAVMAGAYTLLKKYLEVDSRSTVSRVANIALNGLSILSGLHVLKAASKTKSELAPGVLSLLVGASPVLVSDTLALKSGHAGLYEVMPSHTGSTYLHGVTESMRALGIIYTAGQCVSWLKNKIVRSCNAYLERERKHFDNVSQNGTIKIGTI